MYGNGFQALASLYQALAGKPLPKRLHHRLVMVGLLVLLVIWVRMLWVDGRWLWGLAWGW